MQLLCRNIVLPCPDNVLLLCRDRDGQDKRSGVATGLALDRDFMSRQSVFMLRRSSVKHKGFYVTIEIFFLSP